MTVPFEEETLPIKAIIVGVNKYIACDSLNYAVDDASGINDTLTKVYGKIQSILLTDTCEPRYQPIRSNILANMKLIAENARDNENLFFYFAGHGKEIDGEPVILPSDYRDEMGMQSAIKIEEIKDYLVKSSAKFKLIILDSCHSGAVKGRADSGRMTSSTLKAINEFPEGFAIISACGLNQTSFEDDTLKHGVFTHFFLEGISGKADANNDKKVTISELYDYLTPNVKEWVFSKHNSSQIPHLRVNFDGVYVLSLLPPETPKTESLIGTELFSRIYLWQSSREMDWLQYETEGIDHRIGESLDAAVSEILLVLRKEYGIGGFVDNDDTIDFKDGSILRQKRSDEKKKEVTFSTGVMFNYKKERWNTIDNLLLRLDDFDRTWVSMSLFTSSKFNFDLLEKLCADNGYEITNFTIKPKSLTFRGKLFSDDLNSIRLREFDDGSTVYIGECYYPGYFKPHFYTLINPKKVCEILAGTIVQ